MQVCSLQLAAHNSVLGAFLFSPTVLLQLQVTHMIACSFSGESMDPDGTLCYAYYKEGAAQPTFLFPKYALKEQKC